MDYETQYAKVYPSLGAIVKRLKNESLKGDIIVNGPALKELQVMLQTFEPKKDGNEYILPFGDNVRLKEVGNNLFIGLKDSSQFNSEDVLKEQS